MELTRRGDEVGGVYRHLRLNLRSWHSWHLMKDRVAMPQIGDLSEQHPGRICIEGWESTHNLVSVVLRAQQIRLGVKQVTDARSTPKDELSSVTEHSGQIGLLNDWKEGTAGASTQFE